MVARWKGDKERPRMSVSLARGGVRGGAVETLGRSSPGLPLLSLSWLCGLWLGLASLQLTALTSKPFPPRCLNWISSFPPAWQPGLFPFVIEPTFRKRVYRGSLGRLGLRQKPLRQRRPVGGDCLTDYFPSWFLFCFVFFKPEGEVGEGGGVACCCCFREHCI